MDDIQILRLKSQGYCCSQIMVKLALDLADQDNRQLVNFARGLCMGAGLEKGSCGILTAGLCILAMYAPDDKELRVSMQEAFRQEFASAAPGGSLCKEITGVFYPEMNPETCPVLLTRAYAALMATLTAHEMDPGDLGDD